MTNWQLLKDAINASDCDLIEANIKETNSTIFNKDIAIMCIKYDKVIPLKFMITREGIDLNERNYKGKSKRVIVANIFGYLVSAIGNEALDCLEYLLNSYNGKDMVTNRYMWARVVNDSQNICVPRIASFLEENGIEDTRKFRREEK